MPDTVTWHGPYVCQRCNTEWSKDVVSGWNPEKKKVLRPIHCPNKKCGSTVIIDKDEKVNPNRPEAYTSTQVQTQNSVASPPESSDNYSSIPPEFENHVEAMQIVPEEAPSPDSGEKLSQVPTPTANTGINKQQLQDAKEEGGPVAELATALGDGKLNPGDFTEEDFAEFAAIIWDFEIEGIDLFDKASADKMEAQVGTTKHDKRMKRMGRAFYRINKRHPELLGEKWGDILDGIILAGGLGMPVAKSIANKVKEILARKEKEKKEKEEKEAKDKRDNA